jgi:hypothetical protein
MARLQVNRGGHVCGIPVTNLSFTLLVMMTGKMTGVVQRPLTGVVTLMRVGSLAMTCCMPVTMVLGSAPTPHVEAAVMARQKMSSKTGVVGSSLAHRCTTDVIIHSFAMMRGGERRHSPSPAAHE